MLLASQVARSNKISKSWRMTVERVGGGMEQTYVMNISLRLFH